VIVKNTKTFVTYAGPIFFYPGMNEFDKDKSETLIEMDVFEKMVNDGTLVIVGKNGDEEQIQHTTPEVVKQVAKKAERIDIGKLNVENAAKIIRGMYNVAELKEIQERDMRKGVQEVIAIQLRKIDEAVIKKNETIEESE
jgi:hypothetical protein